MTTLAKANAVSLPLAIRRFAVHFVEMCAVMCAGGALLDFGVFGAAGALGYPDLVSRAPALSIAIIAADFAIAMAAYMAVRGHPVQHNVEMSGSTLVGAVALIGMLWVGWIPQAKLESWPALFSFSCGPLCLLMLVSMLVRFDHYGGRAGADIVQPSSAAGDYTCSMHPELRRAEPGRCPVCGMKLVRRPAAT